MKKLPTKEEIKAARALKKQGRTLMVQANKVLHMVHYRRRHAYRPKKLNPKEAEFRTWQHDLSILMPALVRWQGAAKWSPKDLAIFAAQAADHMKLEVELRRPASDGKSYSWKMSSRKIWFVWQAQFDEFVHAMSANTTLNSRTVIERAAALADAMMEVSEKRHAALQRKKKRRTATLRRKP